MSSSRRKSLSSGSPIVSEESPPASGSIRPDPEVASGMRALVQSFSEQHQSRSALFWSGRLLSFSDRLQSDRLLYAEMLIRDSQFRRAAHLLGAWGLDRELLRGCHLRARALAAAGDHEEALKVLDDGADLLEEVQKQTSNSTAKQTVDLRRLLSSVYLLKGEVLESLDNRELAAESYREALRLDVNCAEAFCALTRHQMLSSREENELLQSLPLAEQCSSIEEADLVTFLYKMRLKKYSKPEDVETQERLAKDIDVTIHTAERHYYNCDYNQCFKLTSRVMSEDPYHTECLPVHISCLVELNHSNELFQLGHNLVELYPEWAVAWFCVGAYYYLVGKQDFARRYFNKATQLDRVFGAAWMAYGHSFAMENEHDQAMAAYFKACQLMKGCHLPLLYIGVEYGLTNSVKLAERFFSQALEIAPDDPFLLHELGVTCYQNQEYKQAEKYFQHALRMIRRIQGSVLSEKWESLLNNLGYTSRKLGRLDDALAYHQEALALRPLAASTYSAIGFVYALRGDCVEAVEAFHKALGLRRDDTFATTMLNHTVEQLVGEEPPFPGGAGDDELPKFEPLASITTTSEDIEMTDASLSMS